MCVAIKVIVELSTTRFTLDGFDGGCFEGMRILIGIPEFRDFAPATGLQGFAFKIIIGVGKTCSIDCFRKGNGLCGFQDSIVIQNAVCIILWMNMNFLYTNFTVRDFSKSIR